MKTKSLSFVWKYSIITFLLGFSLLISCNKKNNEETPSLKEITEKYYPISLGTYNEYAVTKINYQIAATPQKEHYYIKEVISDTFWLNHQLNYSLSRFRKEKISDNYLLDSIWAMYTDNYRIIRIENDVPYVKMLFPLREMNSWDGNAFNTKAEQFYQIVYKDKPIVSEHFTGNILHISHKVDTIFITYKNHSYSIYGENTGLIERLISAVKLQADFNKPNFGDTVSGLVYQEKLLKHGME